MTKATKTKTKKEKPQGVKRTRPVKGPASGVRRADRVVGARLTLDEIDNLTKIAQHEDRTVAATIARAVRQYMANFARSQARAEERANDPQLAIPGAE